MLLIWRGWGPLAVAALFPCLASTVGLVDLDAKWPWMVAVGGSLILGGALCVACGMRWNRPHYEHTFFFLPLQVWGWVYLAAAAALAGLAVYGAAKQGLNQGRLIAQAAAGAAGLAGVAGAGWLAIRWAGRWRPAPVPEPAPTTATHIDPVRQADRPRTDYTRLPRFGQ